MVNPLNQIFKCKHLSGPFNGVALKLFKAPIKLIEEVLQPLLCLYNELEYYYDYPGNEL